MRRFFYIVLFIAVVVAFFRSDLADDILNAKDYSMTSWFNKISESAEERVMEEFKSDAEPILSGMSEQQIKYVYHVMKDRETLGVFYLRYCEGEDINPYVFGMSLSEFCSLIGSAGILNR